MTIIAALAWVATAVPHAQQLTPDHRDITYILPLLSGVDPTTAVADLRARIGDGQYFKVGFTAYVFVDMTDPNVDITNQLAVDTALTSTFAQIDGYVAQALVANSPLCLNIILPSRSRTDAVQRASELEDRRNMQWYADNAVAPEAATGALGADLLPGATQVVLAIPSQGKQFIAGNQIYLTSGSGDAEWITLGAAAAGAPTGTYAFDISARFVVQGTGLHIWNSGQGVSGTSGWWGHSRYSRKARAIEEAYVRAIGRKLAAVMALYPETLVAASGDGEVELSYERSPIVHGDLYTEATTVLADYSPFVIAEFRDWLRKGGLYATAPYASEAYVNADRYSGADGLARLNADFNTNFSTWNLRYGNGDPLDPSASDPNAIPTVGGVVSEAAEGSSAFDAPRAPVLTNNRIDLEGSPWWHVWELFRETMLQHHNKDFARWITTNPDGSTLISPDRWFSYQIPADYLYGASRAYPNFRFITSASAISTSYVAPYGGSGITGFNSNVGSFQKPPTDGPYARTLAAAAPAISADVARWAVLEWNPSVRKSSDPTVYRDEMRLVERYRPVLLVPFMWPNDGVDAFVKDTPFETAMQELVQRSGNVPATCRYGMTSATTAFDGVERDGAIGLTASSTTGAPCPWMATSSTADWITFHDGLASVGGINSTAIAFTVGANNGSVTRTGTITIRAVNASAANASDAAAVATITITQAAPCSYTVSPGSATAGSGASTSSFTITTGPACAWSAATNNTHISVTPPLTGTGTATVSYSVAANPAAAIRDGSIAITGSDNYSFTFNVSQDPAPCTFALTPSAATPPFSGGAATVTVAVPTGCAWTAASNDPFVAITSGTSGNGSGTVFYTVAPNPRRVARSGSLTIGGQTVALTQARRPPAFDFTGDGKADLGAFAPDTATWKVLDLAAARQDNQQFGQTGDVPVAGDYDGDGVTERAVFRSSTGMWIDQDGTSVQWGLPGDIPVPADYDGNGTIDRAVVRTNEGLLARWYIQAQAPLSFGLRSDIPFAADFDGDGKADPAVFRPATGTWFVLRSSSNYATYDAYQWGLAGDIPYLGDFDGDGKPDLAVHRPNPCRDGPCDSAIEYVTFSASGYTTSRSLVLGGTADIPMALDFDGDGIDEIVLIDFVEHVGFSWNFVHGAAMPVAIGGYGDVPVAARPRLWSKTRGATDADADGRADLTVFRPSNGIWFTRKSATGLTTYTARQWGEPGDLAAPGDYDGDRAADLAIYRPSTGQWWMLLSGGGFSTARVEQWGVAGDVPVPADYDGDGRTDLAIYRPSTGEWWIRFSASGYTTYAVQQWGLPGDVAVPADYDGDGRTDFAIFRPSTGEWWVRTGTGAIITRQWGLSGDTPVPADYDGDGRADFAVYRPSTGEWYVLDRFANTFAVRQWGLSGDTPVANDYDGDGVADIAVYRPSTGEWYVVASSTGVFFVRQWGLAGDVPIR